MTFMLRYKFAGAVPREYVLDGGRVRPVRRRGPYADSTLSPRLACDYELAEADDAVAAALAAAGYAFDDARDRHRAAVVDVQFWVRGVDRGRDVSLTGSVDDVVAQFRELLLRTVRGVPEPADDAAA